MYLLNTIITNYYLKSVLPKQFCSGFFSCKFFIIFAIIFFFKFFMFYPCTYKTKILFYNLSFTDFWWIMKLKKGGTWGDNCGSNAMLLAILCHFLWDFSIYGRKINKKKQGSVYNVQPANSKSLSFLMDLCMLVHKVKRPRDILYSYIFALQKRFIKP